MRIDILTLFPEMFQSPLSNGIFRRAVEQQAVEINTHDIRGYTHDRHHTVDDYPYGGGAGMVLKPNPVFEATEAIIETSSQKPDAITLLTPQGRLFSQQVAQDLAKYNWLVLICGHYEGIDERVRLHLATDEISIGDFVLSGGELGALVVLDAVLRHVPGVLGSEVSAADDSHSTGLLEYPHYTRPPIYRGWSVPDILLSGNHGEIARWRREQAIIRTLRRRPDLMDKATLNSREKHLVNTLKKT